MRAVDLATAWVLILFGGVVVLDSMRIGIGWGTDGPRSGFFPFWLGVILILASLTIGLQAWRRSTAKPFVTRDQLGPVLKVLWPATAMVILIKPLGLYVAAALYMGTDFKSRLPRSTCWWRCSALRSVPSSASCPGSAAPTASRSCCR
jgi:putative tricarboxylic transport membrane protein